MALGSERHVDPPGPVEDGQGSTVPGDDPRHPHPSGWRPHPARRPTPTLAIGTVVWLASELLFFGSLFAAYFTLRGASHGPWPPKGVELEVVPAALFTAVLVSSSGTIQLAVRAADAGRGRAARRWLALTAALASVFLLNQAREWHGAGFGPSSHAFGSSFFVMTGFHGLHVAAGVFAMVLFLGAGTVGASSTDGQDEDTTESHRNAPRGAEPEGAPTRDALATPGTASRGQRRRPRTTTSPLAPLEVLAYYWHFVDVVWVALFATLFFT